VQLPIGSIIATLANLIYAKIAENPELDEFI
jgi:hypothetical protein